ncbi:MAG: AAA family ATPase [Chitinophagales bacterium]
MFRNKLKDLIQWKDKKHRKPLILNGARQVGKSWLVKEFGAAHFENIAILNL